MPKAKRIYTVESSMGELRATTYDKQEAEKFCLYLNEYDVLMQEVGGWGEPRFKHYVVLQRKAYRGETVGLTPLQKADMERYYENGYRAQDGTYYIIKGGEIQKK